VKVAVLGCGAIGGVVARALAAGEVPGAALVGVIGRGPVPADLPAMDAAGAIAAADLVVEAAGQAALAEHGPAAVAAGTDLLGVSAGARGDPELRAALTAGPGRVHVSSGAIGGLDVLSAAARMGGLDRVRITTTKDAAALLPGGPHPDGPVELRRGSAREIAAAFPKSANVAVAVALAAGDWDIVEAAVVADPAARRTRHVIEACGPAGEYRIEIANTPSERTPTTSAITPYAVLRAIADLAGAGVTIR
jgi:aspartate dehydrogenase